jgi:hypothetical protein
MYLEARKFVSSYSDGAEYQELITSAGFRTGDLPHSTYATVSIEAMYWRKVNHIHDWFVRNVQNGEDDCRSYYVSREQLKELLETCEKVLEARDEEVSRDLLPTATGFFFGSAEFDEYYYEALEETAEGLTKILKNPAFDKMEFNYNASW